MDQGRHSLAMSLTRESNVSNQHEMPHLGGVISDSKARSAAEQDQIVPIGTICPITYGLLDLENVVRHDLDRGDIPLPLRGEDGGEGIGRFVRSGVLRGRIRDDQYGCLESGGGISSLHHGVNCGFLGDVCERVERGRGERCSVFKRESLGNSGVSRIFGTLSCKSALSDRSVLRPSLGGHCRIGGYETTILLGFML